MTELNQIWKCNICGNIVEVVHSGAGELIYCSQPMELLVEKTEEERLTEKHVPVVERIEKGIKVKVGSVPHPMTEKHYIEWVEILADGRVYREFLRPASAEAPAGKAEAKFCVGTENVTAREYCNLHGLWKA